MSTSAPFWVHPRASQSSRPKSNEPFHARHEHGTLPFLSIIALSHSMDAHSQLYGSHHAVSRHTSALARYARRRLDSLKHTNGRALVQQYHSHSQEGSRGPTISLTLHTPTAGSQPIGHKHLENLASLAGFQIRAGGLCNTGVLARVGGLSDDELEGLWRSGRVCGDGRECELSFSFFIANFALGQRSLEETLV